MTTATATHREVANRGLLVASVMLATLMQALDTTIANVALPNMQGSLSATQDQISWVLTSYIVAAAIATPATGWLASVMGRRRLLLIAIAGFTLASVLCGIAGNISEMVAFRLLQGLFGAALVAEDRAAGLRPVLVCPTVGTTGTGAVDPVRAVVDAASGAWVHVDAAWAGVAALCPEHRALLDGVDRADSFCTDAHKWLGTAFDASLLWVRDARALPDALSITPEYLRNAATDSGAVVDYRDWQVPLGRRFRALKLWAVLSGYGLSGLRAHLRGHIAMAAELAGWVADEPGFTLAGPTSLGLVCLRLDSDERTRAALAQVNASGRAFLTHTVVDGRVVIRVAIGGVTTERAHVVALWEQLRKAAASG